MNKSKLIAVFCAVCFLSACGNSADTTSQAELESLKAENEALKSEMQTTTAESETSSEAKAEDTSAAESESASESISAEETTEKSVSDEDGWVSYKDCSIKINSATLVEDYNDEPAIVVEMQFKNDSDEAESCGFTFSIDAYQDGVECDTAILWGDDTDIYDTSTFTTDIKPGVEITVYTAYSLRNDSSDVDIEVSGLYDFNNEVLLRKKFTI